MNVKDKGKDILETNRGGMAIKYLKASSFMSLMLFISLSHKTG